MGAPKRKEAAMADVAAPAKGDDATPQDTDTPNDPVVAQAENPDAVKNALTAERAARKAEKQRADELAAKVEEFQQRDQSETEKLTGQRDKFKTEAEAKAAENRRLRVALDKQLPVDLIDRLRGETQEELEADADKLLDLVKSRNEPEPEPDFDGGAREPAPSPQTPEAAHNDSVLAALGLKRPNN